MTYIKNKTHNNERSKRLTVTTFDHVSLLKNSKDERKALKRICTKHSLNFQEIAFEYSLNKNEMIDRMEDTK